MVSLLPSVDTLAQAIIGSLAPSLYLHPHSRKEKRGEKRACLAQLAQWIARDSYIEVKGLRLTSGPWKSYISLKICKLPIYLKQPGWKCDASKCQATGEEG